MVDAGGRPAQITLPPGTDEDTSPPKTKAPADRTKVAVDQPKSRTPKKDVLLFLELPEQNSTTAAPARGETGRDGRLKLEGLTVSKLALKTDNAEVKTNPAANGGLSVGVRESALSDLTDPLGRFQIEGDEIHFEWEKSALDVRQKPYRDMLRDCILKITTSEGERYALLRRGPLATPRPLRLSGNTEPGKAKKMTRPVDWKWSEDFSSRQKEIVILRARSESRASGPTEFQRDKDDDVWFIEASSNIRMVVKFSDETNRIKFEIAHPNQPTPDDRDVIQSLFDATYSVILGLKVDDQKLELARIGTFPTDKESQ